MDYEEHNINIEKKPKRKYDKILLDEFINRTGASLIGEYDILTRDNMIDFKCNCGKISNKKFYTIVQHNSAFCDECTKNNRLIKIKQICKIRRETEKEKQIIYVPRTNTEKNIYNKLIEKLKEHNSTLIEKYNTINTSSRIYFICGKCNEPGNKAYIQLMNVSGALCHNCTTKIKKKKYNNTIKEQYGVENISQVKEIKEKKYQTALSNGYIMTKDKWLIKIKKKELDKYWEYLFDEIDGYDNVHSMRHISCNTIWPKCPRKHLNQDNSYTAGQGCKTCYQNSMRLKKESFIEEAISRFGKDRFTYENIPDIITNSRTLIEINCIEHGIFTTYYPTHLYGMGGCPDCSSYRESNKYLMTKKEFFECYCEELYNNGVIVLIDEYDDDISILYRESKIICKCANDPNHDIWTPTINNLIYNHTGCPHLTCVNKKIKKTNLEKYGVECALQTSFAKSQMKMVQIRDKDEISNKKKTTCIKNHGVEHPMQSLEIQEKMQKSCYLYKDYKMPSGNIRHVQGYENRALDELLVNYIEDDILTDRGDIPIIQWNDNEKIRRYFPDILIKSEHKFIEVKSTWTYEKQKDEVIKKAESCNKYGYDIEIWIYDKKNKIDIIKYIINNDTDTETEINQNIIKN